MKALVIGNGLLKPLLKSIDLSGRQARKVRVSAECRLNVIDREPGLETGKIVSCVRSFNLALETVVLR